MACLRLRLLYLFFGYIKFWIPRLPAAAPRTDRAPPRRPRQSQQQAQPQSPLSAAYAFSSTVQISALSSPPESSRPMTGRFPVYSKPRGFSRGPAPIFSPFPRTGRGRQKRRGQSRRKKPRTRPARRGSRLGTADEQLRAISASDKAKEKAAPWTRTASRHSLVPLTGVEPVRCLHRGILSPLCLPIPP